MMQRPTGADVPVYASLSAMRQQPTQDEISNGVIPLDTLPASWWNWLWNTITRAQNDALYNDEVIFTELNNVLAAGGLTPNPVADPSAVHDQLVRAITIIKNAIATTTTLGVVKSTEDGTDGTVRVGAGGRMTVNGFGDTSALHTVNKTSLTSAINEVYDLATESEEDIGDISGLTTTAKDTVVDAINEVKDNADSRAIKKHDSATTEYGVGNAANYGHVKLSDTVSTMGEDAGVAATPRMVSNLLDNTIDQLNAVKYDYVITDQESFERILLRDMTTNPLSDYSHVTILLRKGVYRVDASNPAHRAVWINSMDIIGDASGPVYIYFIVPPNTELDTDNPIITNDSTKQCYVFFSNLSICFSTYYMSKQYVNRKTTGIMKLEYVAFYNVNIRVYNYETPEYPTDTYGTGIGPFIYASYLGADMYNHSSLQCHLGGIHGVYAYYAFRAEFGATKGPEAFNENFSVITTTGTSPNAYNAPYVNTGLSVAYRTMPNSRTYFIYAYSPLRMWQNSVCDEQRGVYSESGVYADINTTLAGGTLATGANSSAALQINSVGTVVLPTIPLTYNIAEAYNDNRLMYAALMTHVNTSPEVRTFGCTVKELYAFYDWDTGEFHNRGKDAGGNDVTFDVKNCTLDTINTYNNAAPPEYRIQCLWAEVEKT